VPWHSSKAVRERLRLQRLDLLDERGALFIKLEYQLSGFDRLRALVLEKMPRAHLRPSLPATFGKSTAYHLFQTGWIVGFTLLGWCVGQTSPLLGCGGMRLLIGLILHDYLTTVSKLVVTAEGLEIRCPLSFRKLRFSEVAAVEMRDMFYRGYRHPEVGLFVVGVRKPIRLRGLGSDAAHLYQVLSQIAGTCEPGRS
jgi:hypothetical protein